MKNDDNLFSIGEVAKALGVTRRAILYYEEFGLICPDAKEGTKGNRYYTIDTLVKLRTIRILQGLGLSLSDVRDYLDDAFDLPQMIRRLERQRDELNRHIEGLQERSNTEPPQVKQILTPRQTIYRRTFTAPSVAERTKLLRRTAVEGMRLYGTDLTHRMYLVESHIQRPEEVSFCVAIPPESEGECVELLPATPALSLYHHGAYETLPAAARLLFDYARQHGLTPTGEVRRIYLEGPPQRSDPAHFTTQVVLPLRDAPHE